MNLKEFWNSYKGLHDLILAIVILVLGALTGNYVQQNKEDVKTKLKTFIDKM